MVHTIYLVGYKAIYCAANGGYLELGTKDSYGIEQLQLVKNEEWEGLTIKVVFINPSGQAVEVADLQNGIIDVPPEATSESGRGTITVLGNAENLQRISIDVPYKVSSHSVTSAKSSEITPDVYEQFLKAFPVGGTAGQVLTKKSDADRDVYWATVEGDSGGSDEGFYYTIGHGLKIAEDGTKLEVDIVDDAETDNTLPISSRGVYIIVGNINSLLETI